MITKFDITVRQNSIDEELSRRIKKYEVMYRNETLLYFCFCFIRIYLLISLGK